MTVGLNSSARSAGLTVIAFEINGVTLFGFPESRLLKFVSDLVSISDTG